MLMKKMNILVAMILVASTCFIYAQDEKSKDRIGGIRAGYHGATLAPPQGVVDTTSVLSGFYAGFFRDNRIAPLIFIGTGLEYFKNGTEYSQNSSRELHTISIPVSLKVKLGPIFALGGIGANFKVSEKVTWNGNSYDPSEDQKSNWFDIPLFLGAGVKLWFLTVEARYHWGLLEVRNGYNNQYFQLGAGISF